MEPDEEQSVGHRQLRLRGNAPAQYVQLMPQQHDLCFQPCPSPKRRYQDVKEQDQERDHRSSTYLILSLMPPRMEFSVSTSGQIAWHIHGPAWRPTYSHGAAATSPGAGRPR